MGWAVLNSKTLTATVPGFIPRIFSTAAVLDIFERAFIIGLFYPFAGKNLAEFITTKDPRALLLVFSELLPVILIALRNISSNVSMKPLDWAVGLVGSGLPLLITVQPDVHPLLPFKLCVVIVMTGLFIQIAAKVSLGRSFGIIAANRGVKTQGPYRFVRHPMYLGYTIVHIGNFLTMPSPMNAVFYLLAFTIQVARIYREEAVLRQDSRYRAFARKVRFRLVPSLF